MKNPKFLEKAIRNRIAARRSPNGLEKKLIPILNEYGFEYTGDGKFSIDGANPDFTNYKEMLVIEFAGIYWHKPEYELQRYLRFYKYGWRCLTIWETEIQEAKNKVDNWIRKN